MYFCSISSGSSGNCIYVSSGRTRILIDVGISKKSLNDALKLIKVRSESIDGILLTHEHLDHYRGAGIFSRAYKVPLYLSEKTYSVLNDKFLDIKDINIISNDSEFAIGDLDVKVFKIPHDAVDPVGYSIMNCNKKVSVATDMGYFSDEVFNNLRDSDVVLIESNYNEDMIKVSPYPHYLKKRILSNLGHLSNEDCAKAVIDLVRYSRKNIILGHLSGTNNFPELAYKTVENALLDNGFKIGIDLNLTVAHRSLPSNYMKI